MEKKSVFTWRHGGYIDVPKKQAAAMLMFQTNPVGVELFSKLFVCSNKFP